MYEILKEFQTAIVGIVGFVGVILTLAMNARLARRQHELETHARRTAVRASLLAELDAFLGILERNSKVRDDLKPGQAAVPRVHRLLSKEMVGEIGLLEPDEIALTLEALIAVDDLDRKLCLVAVEVAEHHVFISHEDEKIRSSIYRGLIPSVSAAVKKLSENSSSF